MTVELGRPAAHVAEVIMNRPDALNALSTSQVRRLGDAATTLAADDQVSVASAMLSSFGNDRCLRKDFAHFVQSRSR